MTSRIYKVGSSEVDWKNHPALGKLYHQQHYYCVVFLISARYFASAGHCLRYHHTEYKVKLADKKKYDVASAIEYPNNFYELGKVSVNNIGIGQLSKGASGKGVSIICLPIDSPNFEGSEASMAGWGAIEKYGKTDHQALREVFVRIRPSDECSNPKLINTPVADDKYCAGNPGSVGACDGDDGGPLMVKYNGKLVAAGVITEGLDCGARGEITIITRLNSHLVSWLRERAGNENLCLV